MIILDRAAAAAAICSWHGEEDRSPLAEIPIERENYERERENDRQRGGKIRGRRLDLAVPLFY